jgi:hypothetical protein
VEAASRGLSAAKANSVPLDPFAQNYADIIENYHEDIYNDEDSITQLSVQIFTVKSIARELVLHHSALQTLIGELNEVRGGHTVLRLLYGWHSVP